MRPKSMILILIALGCGLVASIGISQVVERNAALNANKVEMKPIYVALANISAGEELNATRVEVEEWPADKIPEGAITSIEQMEGMSPTQALYAGEPILAAKLADRDKLRGSASRIKPGFRVTAISVDATSAVAGLIWPGDRVDVMVYIGGRPKADVVLRNVEVFAVNDQEHRDIDGDGKSIQARTVSLLVSPEQSEKLLHAGNVGKLHLALRSPNESDNEEDAAEEFDADSQNKVEASEPIAQTPSKPAFDPAELIKSVLGPAVGSIGPSKPKEPEFTMDIIEGGTGNVKKFEWEDRTGLPVVAVETAPPMPQLPPGIPSEISPEALGLGGMVPPTPPATTPTDPTKDSE
jgi:pilus assembly protein CpaB